MLDMTIQLDRMCANISDFSRVFQVFDLSDIFNLSGPSLFLPIFCPMFPISFFLDPRRYILQNDVCKIDVNPTKINSRRSSLNFF
jgi:hypothetical protein